MEVLIIDLHLIKMKTSSKKSKRRGGHITVCAASPKLAQRPNHGVHRHSIGTDSNTVTGVSFVLPLTQLKNGRYVASINKPFLGTEFK